MTHNPYATLRHIAIELKVRLQNLRDADGRERYIPHVQDLDALQIQLEQLTNDLDHGLSGHVL